MHKPLLKTAIAAILLAACSIAPVTTPTPLPPTATPPPTNPPPPPTATATATTAPAASPTLEIAATEASLFPPITDADWQIGPANARVTIVEYGDYQ